MGAYHFARADLNPTNAGAINEANYFLSVAQPYIISGQLPPALDLEGSYLETSFTSAQLTDWVQNWMNTVQAATCLTPVLYIGSSTCSYVNSSLNNYSLWRDDVNGSPTTPPVNIGVWNIWAINQYSWTGTVPGIPGSQTDLDVFNGNLATFNNFMRCSTTTGINQNRLENSLVIYPNPTSSSFHIDYTGITGEAVVNIYDVNGKLVLSQGMNGKTVIDISNLSEGIYNVNISNSEGVINKRLVIARQ